MEKAKKRRIGIISSIILTLLIIFGAVSASALAEKNSKHVNTWARVKRLGKIRWGVKADTKLFGLMDTKTGEPEGFDVDIAKALTVQLSKQSGVPMQADFTIVTSNTRIQLLKNANIDGFIATATITPGTLKWLMFCAATPWACSSAAMESRAWCTTSVCQLAQMTATRLRPATAFHGVPEAVPCAEKFKETGV